MTGVIRAGSICLAVLLAGCASVLDPAPYNPKKDIAVLNPERAAIAPYTPVTILTFTDADDAANKLQALSDGYGAQRDSLMQQQELFDLPMIGLAAAAVINPLFHGARNATLALGLGAAGAAGAKLYYGPQIKVTAYNTASLVLGCAASAAKGISQETQNDDSNGSALVGTLSANIGAARKLLGNNPDLISARDQAVKSLASLQAALAQLHGAPTSLQILGYAIIRTATNQVVGNVQNVSAVEQLFVNAAAPSPHGAPAAPPPARLSRQDKAPSPSAAEIAASLQDDAATADAITQRINTAMGALAKCSAST